MANVPSREAKNKPKLLEQLQKPTSNAAGRGIQRTPAFSPRRSARDWRGAHRTNAARTHVPFPPVRSTLIALRPVVICMRVRPWLSRQDEATTGPQSRHGPRSANGPVTDAAAAFAARPGTRRFRRQRLGAAEASAGANRSGISGRPSGEECRHGLSAARCSIIHQRLGRQTASAEVLRAQSGARTAAAPR